MQMVMRKNISAVQMLRATFSKKLPPPAPPHTHTLKETFQYGFILQKVFSTHVVQTFIRVQKKKKSYTRQKNKEHLMIHTNKTQPTQPPSPKK